MAYGGKPGKSIVLFDGECNLCNGTVAFIIERDPDRRFLFASMQSDAGQELLRRFGLPSRSFSTFVLIEGNRVYTKSTAALRIARKLSGPWPLLYPSILIPSALRDGVYSLIATNRYRLFGKRNACLVPDEDVTSRFLD